MVNKFEQPVHRKQLVNLQKMQIINRNMQNENIACIFPYRAIYSNPMVRLL